MIVDASAIVAIMRREPEADALEGRLIKEKRRLTHSVSFYEAVLAIARLSNRPPSVAEGVVRDFMKDVGFVTLPIGPAEASVALEAFERYGKGRHPAALNMGDCFSYACARIHAMPLLYKGDDFALTDIPAA